MSILVLVGDCRDRLKELPDESVHCVVTSPPYWGLRDYGVAGQIGLEPSYGEFVEEMLAVFRDVRRVLRADGTLWLNLGDSYATGAGSYRNPGSDVAPIEHGGKHAFTKDYARAQPNRMPQLGLKPKDMVGIPWRVAFALQADGWWLRQDIIWSKPNPMPESVTDRCTKAHEYLFLLAKGQWSRRAVKLADLSGERLHLGRDLSGSDPDTWAAKFSIGLATAILNRAKADQKFSSPSLQTEIGEQRDGSTSSGGVECLPAIQRMATYATRLLDAQASPKEFLGEIHRVGFVLGKRGHFLIGGGDAEIALPPAINGYGEGSVAIHDAGKIGEFDFCHGQIIARAPTTCSYYFDQDAILEPVSASTVDRLSQAGMDDQMGSWRVPGKTNGAMKAVSRSGNKTRNDATARGCPHGGVDGSIPWEGSMRIKRSVWTVTTQPFFEAHFATFPPALIKPCILAGCPEGGTVLDPFGGAGTTGLVADRLKRNAILIELNPEYAAMAERRIQGDGPLFAQVTREAVA